MRKIESANVKLIDKSFKSDTIVGAAFSNAAVRTREYSLRACARLIWFLYKGVHCHFRQSSSSTSNHHLMSDMHTPLRSTRA